MNININKKTLILSSIIIFSITLLILILLYIFSSDPPKKNNQIQIDPPPIYVSLNPIISSLASGKFVQIKLIIGVENKDIEKFIKKIQPDIESKILFFISQKEEDYIYIYRIQKKKFYKKSKN